MAQLPEGITELLHHEKLSVPLVCALRTPFKVNNVSALFPYPSDRWSFGVD